MRTAEATNTIQTCKATEGAEASIEEKLAILAIAAMKN
jgi:hypothetical protein